MPQNRLPICGLRYCRKNPECCKVPQYRTPHPGQPVPPLKKNGNPRPRANSECAPDQIQKLNCASPLRTQMPKLMSSQFLWLLRAEKKNLSQDRRGVWADGRFAVGINQFGKLKQQPTHMHVHCTNLVEG